MPITGVLTNSPIKVIWYRIGLTLAVLLASKCVGMCVCVRACVCVCGYLQRPVPTRPSGLMKSGVEVTVNPGACWDGGRTDHLAWLTPGWQKGVGVWGVVGYD